MIQVRYATYCQTFNIFYTHEVTEVNKKGSLKGKKLSIKQLKKRDMGGKYESTVILPW